MKKAILVFLVVCISFPAAAQTYSPQECKEKFCKPKLLTPKQKCEKRRGKWRNGVCFILKIKRIKSKPVIKNIITERILTKPEYKIIKVPVEKTIIREVPTKSPKTKLEEKQWWWIGPGIFALGFYMSEDRFFLTGLGGKLTFAINERFRVSGNLGFAFWQKFTLLAGADFQVRAIQNLFVSFGVLTGWGDFENGLTVNQRFLLGTVGLEYWIRDRASIVLSFPLGFLEKVVDCEKETIGNFIGGNMLNILVYF